MFQQAIQETVNERLAENRGIRVVSRATTASVGSQTWNVEVPSRGDLKEECHCNDDAKESGKGLHGSDCLGRLTAKSVVLKR